jgi:sulfide:quinone oxidoreductase
LYNRFDTAGKPLKAGDIAIVDAAEHHNYQVCFLFSSSIQKIATQHRSPKT